MTFFDQLRLDDEEQELNNIGFDIGVLSFSEFMSAINLREKWVYLGSDTIPPCSRNVYH